VKLERVGAALANASDEGDNDHLERRQHIEDEAKRASALAVARSRLVEEWDDLPFEERRALLREVVTGIVVTDEDIRVDFAA
jgi:hypothetical protein